MTATLADICSELNIKVVALQRYRGPMETMAVGSMERILRQHGYSHLKMVLMSIVETSNNKRELVGPVIWAISDLIRAHPAWAERATDWFEAFDRVDLGKIREIAKRNHKAARPRAAIATLLFGFLFSRLEKQGELI